MGAHRVGDSRPRSAAVVASSSMVLSSSRVRCGIRTPISALLGSYARLLMAGDLAGREFVAFWLDGDDRILASMNVNIWGVVGEI